MTPEIFTKDWFDGRTIDAISADDSKRIGWEDELTNYSEFLFNQNYIDRLINDKDLVLSELDKILDAMNVCASVEFLNGANTAYTDGLRIAIDNKYVPTSKLKRLDTIYSKFDVLIGMLIHEACHCKYTDFEYCAKNKKLLNEIIHSIHNVLEDECIERNIGLSFPGYSNFIKSVKKELFKHQMNRNSIEWNTDELQDIFNLLLIVIRYPEKLNIVPENILEQHSELFEKIYKILDFKGILKCEENLNCTRDTISAAIAIFNLLNINEKDLSKSGKRSENENDNIKNIKKSMGDALGSLSGSMIDGTDEFNIDSVSETINNEQRISIEKKLTYDDVDTNRSWGWGGGYGVNTTIKDMNKSDVAIYNKLYGGIKEYIKCFKKIIVPTHADDQYKKIDYQRSGQLDPNQIINALQGGRFVNTKLQKTVNKKNPKYALVLTLDESSSMFGKGTRKQIYTSKTSPYGIASHLSVLFYEAMKDYKDLEIYIYGHGDNINRYIFPRTKTDKYILGKRQLQGGQDDAKSIDTILTEVRKNTSLPIIMVNITDSLYLSGITDMTKLIEKYEDVVFTLMCVSSISKKHLTSEHIKTNDTMYGAGNWVMIDDNKNLRKIAIQLAKVFKSKYKKQDRN